MLLWAWSRWSEFNDDDHVVFACIGFAQRRLIDRARRVANRVDLRATFAEHELGTDDDPAEAVARHDECRPRWEEFASLPPASQALLLAVAHGASYDDLAVRFAVSPAALRVRIYCARAFIKAATPSSAASAPALRFRSVVTKLRAWRALARPSAPGGRTTLGLATLAAALVSLGPSAT